MTRNYFEMLKKHNGRKCYVCGKPISIHELARVTHSGLCARIYLRALRDSYKVDKDSD